MSADFPQNGPPPPGYQPPGYPPGYPPPRPPGLDIGKAFSWAWQKFRANTATLMLGAFVILVIGIAVYVGALVIAHSVTGGSMFLHSDPDTGLPTDFGSYLANLGVVYAILFVASVPLSVLTAGYSRAGLRIADGEKPTFGSIFSLRDAPRIMLTSVTLSLGILVGLVLCYLPGLALGLFSSFTLLFVLDHGQKPVDAIKSSFALVKTNFGPALGVTLLAGLVGGAGVLVCLVGALVSMPVAMLVHVYAYRFFSGGTIAP